tara:strand:- start:67 stop:252 length:186 start_codon:yes stop_codon:yes gene_type:complete
MRLETSKVDFGLTIRPKGPGKVPLTTSKPRLNKRLDGCVHPRSFFPIYKVIYHFAVTKPPH